MLSRLRRAFADLGMLFVLPAMIALLPWRAGFGLLKRIARSPRLYRPSVNPAWNAARNFPLETDLSNEAEWKFQFRLLRLVDHVDVYLCLLRGTRWRRRWITQHGEWPQPGPRVWLTCHWGAGWWLWPLLRERGFATHFLARAPQGRSLGLTRVSHAFAHFRAWALRRAGGAGALFTGGSSEKIRAALAAGDSVMGMLDLPAQPEQRTLTVPLLGRAARFPYGLVRLAAQLDVPISIVSFGLDNANGHRDVCIENLPPGCDAQQAMVRYAAHLDARLRTAPSAWQIWREAALFFEPADEVCERAPEAYNSDSRDPHAAGAVPEESPDSAHRMNP
jgi:hypothetical protein